MFAEVTAWLNSWLAMPHVGPPRLMIGVYCHSGYHRADFTGRMLNEGLRVAGCNSCYFPTAGCKNVNHARAAFLAASEWADAPWCSVGTKPRLRIWWSSENVVNAYFLSVCICGSP